METTLLFSLQRFHAFLVHHNTQNKPHFFLLISWVFLCSFPSSIILEIKPCRERESGNWQEGEICLSFSSQERLTERRKPIKQNLSALQVRRGSPSSVVIRYLPHHLLMIEYCIGFFLAFPFYSFLLCVFGDFLSWLSNL